MLNDSLAAALDDDRHELIITSGQRLAREVGYHQARSQMADGHLAWLAADVLPWHTWMRRLAEATAFTDAGIVLLERKLLNGAQARTVWQRVVGDVLRSGAGDVLGVDALVNEVMQAFALLRRFRIDDGELVNAAVDDDSRFLVRCVEEMQRRLAKNGWLLEDELPGLLVVEAELLRQQMPERVLLAGFDRLTPDQQHFIDAFPDTRFDLHGNDEQALNVADVVRCPCYRDELMAAGAWARTELQANPACRIGVVVPGLAAEADDVRRQFAEGFAPASQCADGGVPDAGFEVSYGRPLADYPAVATALELLRAAVQPPRFKSLSRLLRSAVLNDADATQNIALELSLRDLPDRQWSLDDLLPMFSESADVPAWISAARRLGDDAAQQRRPSQWAERIDIALGEAGWLTTVATDSEVFQLRNAFHSTLNALASLDSVLGNATLGVMLSALRERAQATVYQPQSAACNVLVCGPLETYGLHFDALWIAGLDAARWPPAGRGSGLLPRRLQREYGLPDATPEQSREFWQRQFRVLTGAASRVVCSFAQFDGDSELLPTPDLRAIMGAHGARDIDASLGTVSLIASAATVEREEMLDRFDSQRRLHGGYATLKQLLSDPFSAVVSGRWGCRALAEPGVGVNGAHRGQVLHRALQLVFGELPDRDSIAACDDSTLRGIIARAVADAIRPLFGGADDVLTALLRMEEQRCRQLLDGFVEAELQRPAFRVVGREAKRQLNLQGLLINLRVDRIDSIDGASLIIDYKTGANMTRVTGQSISDQHFQLLAYALTEREPLAGLAIAQVGFEAPFWYALIDADEPVLAKTRQVVAVEDLGSQLPLWREHANSLAQRFIDGDARINPSLQRDERLATALLCRFAEELAVD